jgi:ribosomal protein S18 acetylase RimI-like enzyme
MNITYKISKKPSNKALNDLYQSAWPHHKLMDFSQELDHSFIHITAYDDTRLVGFVKLIWDGGQHGFVLEPTVHKDYQHNGIGTELLRQLIDESKRRNLTWLHVDFEPHLLKYYRNVGFVHTEAGLFNLKE